MWRFKEFFIALDQCFNVLIGSGWADETLSAYCWRKQYKVCKLINLLALNPNHCMESYRSEIERNQLPAEYRK